MGLPTRFFSISLMICLNSAVASAALVTGPNGRYEHHTVGGVEEVTYVDAVDQDGAHCNRGITFERLVDPSSKMLTPEQISDLVAGKQVTVFVPQKSGYEIGYVIRIAGFDPELVMAVYSSAGEHKGEAGLGDFIVESKVLADNPWFPGNPYRVFYEQQVSAPYSNGEYTMENKISRTASGAYVMDSRLLDSTDSSFSPRWADGYLYSAPYQAANGQTGVFVVACNYMVPRTTSWPGTFRNLARERLTLSGEHLMNWLARVYHDQKRMDFYRARLRKML